MALLLSMTTMIYGLNVARSIIQEKTSRIFEVMLATVKPGDMLAGKLIGVGAVGLTQILIWVVAGAAILLSPFAAALMTGESRSTSPGPKAFSSVYFLLGYLLYSSLFAGLAATCETEQELQMYMPWPPRPLGSASRSSFSSSTTPTPHGPSSPRSFRPRPHHHVPAHGL